MQEDVEDEDEDGSEMAVDLIEHIRLIPEFTLTENTGERITRKSHSLRC